MKYLIILILGALTSLVVIKFIQIRMAGKSWAYPLLLATFPVFYLVFAFWVNDKNAVKEEFLFGLIFFIIVALYLFYQRTWSEHLLAFGFLGHAFYDITHDLWIVNRGIPVGWPEFCGVVDLFIGFYLLYQIKQNRIYRVE